MINLFTDYKNDPLYRGVLLNYLHSRFTGQIVETTHFLPFDNIMTSGFIIRNLYQSLPEGSIHIICTNTSHSKIKQYIGFEYNYHIFLLADNGLVNLITDGQPVKVYSLAYKRTTFAELDVLAPAALDLAYGKSLRQIGSLTENYKVVIPMKPVVSGNRIKGTILYIDSYGNAITNISREFFEQHGKDRKYKIWVNLPLNIVRRVDTTYRSSPGDFTAVFNSFGLLEIAVIYGNVSEMLNLKEGETEVVIEFY